jgi:predicted dehydrogenase
MRFGIVGTNFISDAFVEACRKSGAAEPYAVFSRAEETGRAFALKNGVEKVYTDYREMLRDELVEAVYIASPTMCHLQHAKAAIECGKAVLCEKMITATLDEFYELKACVSQHGGILIEAMRPDFDLLISTLREQLNDAGEIKDAYFEFRQYSRRYDKFKEGIIMNAFDPSMKNSALADIGIYPLHLCISLFGEPISVTSEASFLHNGFMADGISTLHYGGFDAKVVYSKTLEGENVSRISAEKKELILNKVSEPASLTVIESGEKVYEKPQGDSNMANEVSEFVRIVTERDYEKADKLIAVTEATMRTVDKIYRDCGVTFN